MSNLKRKAALVLALLMFAALPAEALAADISGEDTRQTAEEADEDIQNAGTEKEQTESSGETSAQDGTEQSETDQKGTITEDQTQGEASVSEEQANEAGQTADTESEEEETQEEEFSYYDPQDPENYRSHDSGTDGAGGDSLSLMATSSAKYSDCYTETGIDVSYHNGNIDWAKVKSSKKADFALIRVAYRSYENGTLKTDVKAKEYLKNAKAQGIPVGVYIFSQAISTSEAVAEADYIIDRLQSFGYSASQMELPIVLDYEYVATGVGRLYKAKLSKAAATDICVAFCNRVRARGYTPMVYANKSMLTSNLYAADISQSSAIWMANYTSKSSYSGEYEYWQYSDSGTVSGIDEKTDLNYRYVNTLRIGASTSGSITLNWSAYNGSSSYLVMRKSGSSYQQIAATDACTYTDSGLSPGASYSYKIIDAGTGRCIGFNTGITGLNTTTTVSAKGVGFDRVQTSWTAVSGAKGYYVQRAAGSGGSFSTIATVSATSYKDPNCDASTSYRYRIQPYAIVFNGRAKGGVSGETTATTLSAIKGKTKSSGLKLRKSTSTSSKNLGKIKKKNTTVTLLGSQGSWYKVKVKIKGKYKTGYLKKSRVKANDPTVVKKTKLSIKSRKKTKIKIGWKKVSGASGYEIQRYNKATGAYETVATITKGSKVTWTNKGLTKNTKYKYRVRAYKNYSGSRYYGSWSAAKTAKTKK